MTKRKTPKAPKCQSAEPKDRPLPAAPAEAPPGDSFVKWCNWWSQFPDRAALSRAKPAALLKMMLFWNSLPLFWTPPSSGAGRASWCVYGARAAEALVLAAAARPPLDGLKIEAAHKIFRQYIDSAKYYKKAAEDEAHKNKEGYALFHYSDTLLEVLADHGPSEPECETFRQGLDELKRLSLRLESEAAGAGGSSAKADEATGAKPAEPSKDAEQNSKNKYQWLAEAMLLVQEHPELSDAKIARKIGKHPSTLSRNATYRRAAGKARAVTVPKGYKNSKTGQVEAVAPQ